MMVVAVVFSAWAGGHSRLPRGRAFSWPVGAGHSPDPRPPCRAMSAPGTARAAHIAPRTPARAGRARGVLACASAEAAAKSALAHLLRNLSQRRDAVLGRGMGGEQIVHAVAGARIDAGERRGR